MRRKFLVLFCLLGAAGAFSLPLQNRGGDMRLKNAFRRPAVNGWTFVHLEGTPAEIGYQHGYLLAPEILDMKGLAELELKHDDHKDWTFFRDAARNMMWPRIEQEYRDELQGIADGLNADRIPTKRGSHWQAATVRSVLATVRRRETGCAPEAQARRPGQAGGPQARSPRAA